MASRLILVSRKVIVIQGSPGSKSGVKLSNYSIIRVTLNAEFDTMWFCPVFANTVDLTQTLCILAKTSVLGG